MTLDAASSKSDYYPFGMGMPGIKYSAGSGYRYGFNGKENDNEVKGEGNQQDYGMRIYDPRVGRFLSMDPLTRQYPYLTSYQFASDTPIQAIDLDELEKISVVTNSFAPFDWFVFDGMGEYKGDGENRKYGDDGTYRLSASVSLENI